MDDELREAVLFAKAEGAKSVTYKSLNGEITVVFGERKPETWFAIPEQNQLSGDDSEQNDDFLLYYSAGG